MKNRKALVKGIQSMEGKYVLARADFSKYQQVHRLSVREIGERSHKPNGGDETTKAEDCSWEMAEGR